jgi:hypothetical protein
VSCCAQLLTDTEMGRLENLRKANKKRLSRTERKDQATKRVLGAHGLGGPVKKLSAAQRIDRADMLKQVSPGVVQKSTKELLRPTRGGDISIVQLHGNGQKGVCCRPERAAHHAFARCARTPLMPGSVEPTVASIVAADCHTKDGNIHDVSAERMGWQLARAGKLVVLQPPAVLPLGATFAAKVKVEAPPTPWRPTRGKSDPLSGRTAAAVEQNGVVWIESGSRPEWGPGRGGNLGELWGRRVRAKFVAIREHTDKDFHLKSRDTAVVDPRAEECFSTEVGWSLYPGRAPQQLEGKPYKLKNWYDYELASDGVAAELFREELYSSLPLLWSREWRDSNQWGGVLWAHAVLCAGCMARYPLECEAMLKAVPVQFRLHPDVPFTKLTLSSAPRHSSHPAHTAHLLRTHTMCMFVQTTTRR